MTTVYGANLSTALQGTGQSDGSVVKARVRVITEIITMASQPTSNTIPVANPDKGWTFLYGIVTTSATLGSAAISIGVTGTTAKYKASAVFTSTDTPTLFGKAAAKTKLTAAETLILTIASASLPSSGTLCIDTFWAAA